LFLSINLGEYKFLKMRELLGISPATSLNIEFEGNRIILEAIQDEEGIIE